MIPSEESHITCEFEFAGELLQLLGEHAAWWPKERTLFIADLHFGKDATFRAAGIPMPSVVSGDLRKLDLLMERCDPQRLFVLGDLIHARRGRDAAVIADVAAWRVRHSQVAVVLIRGNHDRHAGDPPTSWQIECAGAPQKFGPWALAHTPTFQESTPTLAGHLHPKYRLCVGAEELRLPCFLHRNNTLVLPAFSHFIDHAFVKPQPNDRIFVVAESEVIEIKRR